MRVMKIRSWKKLAECLQERYQHEFFADARKKVIRACVWDRYRETYRSARETGQMWNLVISWNQGWEVSCPEENVRWYHEEQSDTYPFDDSQLGNLAFYVGDTFKKICSTWQ